MNATLRWSPSILRLAPAFVHRSALESHTPAIDRTGDTHLTSQKCYYLLFQLRKPVSTLSIPAAMKGPPGREGSTAGEEAGIALVGVHSDYPRYTEERGLSDPLTKVNQYWMRRLIHVGQLTAPSTVAAAASPPLLLSKIIPSCCMITIMNGTIAVRTRLTDVGNTRHYVLPVSTAAPCSLAVTFKTKFDRLTKALRDIQETLLDLVNKKANNDWLTKVTVFF